MQEMLRWNGCRVMRVVGVSGHNRPRIGPRMYEWRGDDA